MRAVVRAAATTGLAAWLACAISCASRAVPDDVIAADAAHTVYDCTSPAVVPDDVPQRTSDALCSVDGWCWEDPLPHGNAIASFWASSAIDAWAITFANEILHWDGVRWRAVEPPQNFVPQSVSGLDANSVWFAGRADAGALRAAHWNGSTWSDVVTLAGLGDRAQVWCAANGQVWITSQPNRIARLDSTWVNSAPPDFAESARIVHAGETVFAIGMRSVGAPTEIRRWDGAAWQPFAVPTVDSGSDRFASDAIGGTAADDVWALDSMSGTTRHWDGTQWSMPARDFATPFFVADIVSGPVGHLFLLGRDTADTRRSLLWQRDPTQWTPIDPPPIGFARLADTRAASLWAYGTNGGVAMRDATGWTRLSGTSPLARGASWSAIDGTDDTNLWVAGVGGGSGPSSVARIVHRDASGWHDAWSCSGFLESIVANASDDVWAAGGTRSSATDSSSGLLVHWDGLSWNHVDVPIGPTPEYWTSVASTGPRDVWLAGATLLVHFDGSAWSRVDAGNDDDAGEPYEYWTVDASAPDDVWVVGGHSHWGWGIAFASHWDGMRWRSETVGTFYGSQWGPPGVDFVRGASDEAWIVGSGMARAHRVGGSWVHEDTGSEVAWAGASGDVWFGNQSVIHRALDGTSTEMVTGAALRVRAGWTSRAGTTWIVVENGGILRLDRP